MSNINGLSEEELKEFREIFNLVDKDGGGSISRDELAELMATIGIKASREELDLMISEIDEDNNGEIEFEEFVAVMSRKVNATYTQEEVINAFKAFCPDPSNPVMKIKDLEKALANYGADKITPEQAAELCAQIEADSTGSGSFNYVDYVKMMMSN